MSDEPIELVLRAWTCRISDDLRGLVARQWRMGQGQNLIAGELRLRGPSARQLRWLSSTASTVLDMFDVLHPSRDLIVVLPPRPRLKSCTRPPPDQFDVPRASFACSISATVSSPRKSGGFNQRNSRFRLVKRTAIRFTKSEGKSRSIVRYNRAR